MSRLLLADDLSGALDAAAAFHAAGWRVTVALSPDAWPKNDDDCIVALTTETRNVPPAEAAFAVRRALAEARARGAELVYKKIDSTLRGPVAAEVAALLEALPGVRVLFAPANPRVGRTVRGGVLRVHGVPVSETEFARDPVSPVRESELRRLLGAADGARVVIADTETEVDLAAAVARMEAAGGEWVAVGSGALARPVAARMARTGGTRGEPHAAGFTGPVLMVGGSAHAGNRAQAAVLARERGVPVHEFRLAEPGLAGRAALASLGAGGGASLLVEQTRGDSGAVLRALAAAVQEIVERAGTVRIFVTGGETAFAVCGALGIATLEFGDELEPGLSVSRAVAASGVTMLLAIKPGGFGSEETWVRAWDRLRLS